MFFLSVRKKCNSKSILCISAGGEKNVFYILICNNLTLINKILFFIVQNVFELIFFPYNIFFLFMNKKKNDIGGKDAVSETGERVFSLVCHYVLNY